MIGPRTLYVSTTINPMNNTLFLKQGKSEGFVSCALAQVESRYSRDDDSCQFEYMDVYEMMVHCCYCSYLDGWLPR